VHTHHKQDTQKLRADLNIMITSVDACATAIAGVEPWRD